MQESIICLPLTLPSEVKPGLVLTPFVISMVAKLTGLKAVCCLNLTGLRYKGLSAGETSSRVTNFRVLLKRLRIHVDHYWTDNHPQYIDRLQSYCDILVASGRLYAARKNIFACECGAVEVVAEAINDWMLEGKVLERRDNKVFCKLCGTTLVSREEDCLMFQSSFGDVMITALPSFYQNEVIKLQEFDQPILVSRQRKSDYSVSLFGTSWWLDTDFCWSMLFHSLIKDEFLPKAVVISNHVLKQLVWALGISRALNDNISNITAIVTPYVSFGESESRLSRTEDVSDLIERYGQIPVQILLGSGLKWDQKEVCVSSRLLFWSLKALARETFVTTTIRDEMCSIPDTLGLMDGNLSDRLIADLRKEPNVCLSKYHKLLLGKE